MNLNHPINIDNQIYDKATINLAVSTNYTNGVPDLNMAIRIVPTRIDPNGNAVTADANAMGIFRGRLSEMASPSEIDLVNNLLVSLQNLLNEKT